ncbi:MAG: hypothetical protein WCW68_11190 [Methanothrix sp.]
MLCIKKLPTVIYILIALMSIGLALAEEYSETTTQEGLRFDSNQTVEGFGIASSYRNMESSGRMLHSHSSGSGVFTSESKSLVQNGVKVKRIQESFESNTGIGLQENTSNAYSPTKLDFPGSFRSEPISSLWSDSTFAGSDGIDLKASFDHLQALNKEMTTKISGKGSYDELNDPDSSKSFTCSMKLNAIFNGTGRIGAYTGPLNRQNPDDLVDEYYRGTFTISNKMQIGFKLTLRQANEDWLPCWSGGWDDMNYKDKKSFPLDADRIFNCMCTSISR